MKKKKIFFLFALITTSFFTQISFCQVNRQWVSTYTGAGGDNVVAHSMAVDISGNVYVTGGSKEITTGFDYATIKYNSGGVQQWAAKYNGQGARNDYASAIAVDNSGNVYVTGRSNLSTTADDFLTIKYNSSGDSVWVRRYSGLTSAFNDDAQAIAVDAAGNVYVTGLSVVNGINYCYATIKYNSTGTQQWVTIYEGPGNGNDIPSALAIDGSGNVYVTGMSLGVSSGFDYATVKYNSAGVEQWSSRYSGLPINLSDGANALAVDGSGNVYVTGESPGNGTGTDYATIKYNSAGVQQWASRYVGPSADEGHCIGLDASGNVYVSGVSLGSGTVDDYATIKYNSSGVEQWVRRFDGRSGNVSDIAHSLVVDNSGNIYVTGESNQGNTDYYEYATIKYNSSGDLLWVQTYDGMGSGHDRAYAIAVDISGNVYVTGQSGPGNVYATIKYKPSPSASITALVEGFYNSSSNKMVSDSIRVYLRNITVPYNKVDSSIAKLDSLGSGKFYFSNIVNGTNYYIVLKHRNSIETWSSSGKLFSSDTLSYNFYAAANKAYGNNQKQIDNSPVRFGIYSGDVNQDGTVDLSDVTKIDNDSYNFVSGYTSGDLNGDNNVDLSDAAIADNNAFNFVSKITP